MKGRGGGEIEKCLRRVSSDAFLMGNGGTTALDIHGNYDAVGAKSLETNQVM